MYFVYEQRHVQNMFLGISRQQRPRSTCAYTQSDQDFHCGLTESLDTAECMNGEQRPRWYFGHVQNDLYLRILHMFKGTFSLEIQQKKGLQKYLQYSPRLAMQTNGYAEDTRI